MQALYTIRSERQLMERIDFDLLFRWFVGLRIDDAVWDASTFAKNRDRFLEMDAAAELLAGVVNHADVRRQMSRDHFSVDGTLIDAHRGLLAAFLPESDRSPADDRWASMKSFRPGHHPDHRDDGSGRNAELDFHRQKRSNDTHASTADPGARLYEKADGQPSRLCFAGTALMEHRNGLVVDGRLTRASGISECLAAVDLADQHIGRGGTLAGDKGFDTADVVAEQRERRITPHVAQNADDTGPRRPGGRDGNPTSTDA